MKKFLLNVTLFLSVVLIVFIAGIVLPGNIPGQNMHYSIFDKEKLLENTDSPRLILVGGSNLSFGIDSKRLQDSLGRHVVNTAIHAGYGLQYIIDCVAPHIKQGDIVLLAPEYNNFFGNSVWGGEVLIQALEVNPTNLEKMTFKQFGAQLPYVPKHSIEKLLTYLPFKDPKALQEKNAVYERWSFNKLGDVEAHWNKPNEPYQSYDVQGKVFNQYTIQLINHFKQLIEAKQGRLLVTFPCLNHSGFQLTGQKIREVAEQFAKNQYTVLGNPEKYSFPDSLYFNSMYHLNKKGVDLRTTLLLQDLKKQGL